MAKLSQKLSQKNQTESKHAEARPLFFENLFEYGGPKSNTHRMYHPRIGAIEFLNFYLTENSQPRETERRWSIRCVLIRKVGLMFYTLEEVAKDHLKVSRSTVYRLIRNGELQSVKVLGCTRIAPTELERFERMIGGF